MTGNLLNLIFFFFCITKSELFEMVKAENYIYFLEVTAGYELVS